MLLLWLLKSWANSFGINIMWYYHKSIDCNNHNQSNPWCEIICKLFETKNLNTKNEVVWLLSTIREKQSTAINKLYPWASQVPQTVKNLPAMQETWVQSLCPEDPLKWEMATYSNILAQRIPWTGHHGGLQSMGSQRVGHYWVTNILGVLLLIGQGALNDSSNTDSNILDYNFKFQSKKESPFCVLCNVVGYKDNMHHSSRGCCRTPKNRNW